LARPLRGSDRGHLRRRAALPRGAFERPDAADPGRARAPGRTGDPDAGRRRPLGRRGVPRPAPGHLRGRRGDDAAPAAGAHDRRAGPLDPGIFPLLRPRPRKARPCRAGRQGHASRADEPRRRDRFRRRRRPLHQPDPGPGRDGRRRAHGGAGQPGRAAGQRLMAETRPLAFTGARLVDPAAGYDGPGCLMVADGVIAEVIRQPTHEGLSADIEEGACDGAMLAPGLVDLRVKTGEPGAETKETLKSAARAAVAGGVTSIVVQPDTDPVVDEPSVVDFILRRSRDIGLAKVYPAG